MRQFFYLLLVVFVFVQCKSESDGSSKAPASGKVVKATPKGKEYAKLPSDSLQFFYANTDEIDLIAYDAPLSMNFAKANSVRYILQLINSKPVLLSDDCKPNGHLVFTGQGDVLGEADLYFHDGCKAVAFMKNNKIAYVNELSQVGIDFFMRFIPEKKNQYTEDDIDKLRKEYESQGLKMKEKDGEQTKKKK